MTSTLQARKFHITTIIGNEDPLGRGSEDKTLNPKKIMILPDNMNQSVFEFILIDEETELYNIKCDGSLVIVDNGKLFAKVDEDSKEWHEWHVVPEPDYGPFTYAIKTQGWTYRGRSEFEQVQLATIPSRGYYLFNLYPVKEDDPSDPE